MNTWDETNIKEKKDAKEFLLSQKFPNSYTSNIELGVYGVFGDTKEYLLEKFLDNKNYKLVGINEGILDKKEVQSFIDDFGKKWKFFYPVMTLQESQDFDFLKEEQLKDRKTIRKKYEREKFITSMFDAVFHQAKELALFKTSFESAEQQYILQQIKNTSSVIGQLKDAFDDNSDTILEDDK